MKNIIHDDNGYIYESPDGGNKVYRRLIQGIPIPGGMTYLKEFVGNISGQPKGQNKSALVLGAGGFIGSHLVKFLKTSGYWVRGIDLKYPEYDKTVADDFRIADLRLSESVKMAFSDVRFDEVYQLAADMGGAGFVFTGEHDFDIMHNSSQINLNVLEYMIEHEMKNTKIFYSSSACMYPEYNQTDPDNPNCAEDSAYPANPDSEYGWEKLFSERMYLAAARNYGINVRIARFHNIFGPYGTWQGGREKAPAAMCRKIAMLPPEGGEIEIWGDGKQTRSFLYIDACIEGIRRLVQSDSTGPVNIGSEEMVTINELADMVVRISGKKVTFKHIEGPLGVRGRNSDNHLIRNLLGWEPKWPLFNGLLVTYTWIKTQVQAVKNV